MNEYDYDYNEYDNSEIKIKESDNSTVYIMSCILCVCCISIIIILGITYYKKYQKNKKIASDKLKPIIQGINCSISNISNNLINACSNPFDDSHIIELVEGPILKISKSSETHNDIDKSNKPIVINTDNYYIIMPYVFAIDYANKLSKGLLLIETLPELLESFDDVENRFNNQNTIPDKCLGTSSSIRTESTAPYNTTCLFFPGLSSITAVSNTIQLAILPFIPLNILNEYYSAITKKIKDTKKTFIDTNVGCIKDKKTCNTNVQFISTLTILEYVMYLSLINYTKSGNYKYFGQCDTAGNDLIDC